MIILLAIVAVSVCVWAGCSGRSEPDAPIAAAVDGYAGAEACAECHKEIYEKQSASHHALTLRRAEGTWEQAERAGDLRLADRETGIEYGLKAESGRFWVTWSEGGNEAGRASVDYLLGSGHHGISPMSFDGRQWRYLAPTYYAGKGWDFSPMHELGSAEERRRSPQGWAVSAEDVEKCFQCHSTRLEFSDGGVDHRRSETGVRCESCHGPGRAHIEAVRGGSGTGLINNPRRWKTASFMALCRQCHNENSTIEGTKFGIPTDPHSAAFAKLHVDGLQRSRCFVRSNGKMTCTTCHDPHGNTASDSQTYKAKCLGCHQSGAARQTICPVQPKGDCVSCHMPKVQVEKHTRFRDHWIRARSPFAPQRTSASR